MLEWILKFMVWNNIESQPSKKSFTLLPRLFIIHRSSTWCPALRLSLILSHSIRLLTCLNIMIVFYIRLCLMCFHILVFVLTSYSHHFLPAAWLIYVGAIVQFSSVVDHLFGKIIVHVSRFLGEPISWIERIAINVVILILDMILLRARLLVVSILAVLVILGIGVSQAC